MSTAAAFQQEQLLKWETWVNRNCGRLWCLYIRREHRTWSDNRHVTVDLQIKPSLQRSQAGWSPHVVSVKCSKSRPAPCPPRVSIHKLNLTHPNWTPVVWTDVLDGDQIFREHLFPPSSRDLDCSDGTWWPSTSLRHFMSVSLWFVTCLNHLKPL